MNVPGSSSDDSKFVDKPAATTDPDAEPPTTPRRPDPSELAQIFGGPSPHSSSDERDDRETGGLGDRWYQENRPPHHGD